jgi:hypothetical protein
VVHDSVVEDERGHVSCPNPRATFTRSDSVIGQFLVSLALGNAPLGAPPIRNHIGGAPSTATPRLCGRVSFGDGLGGNQGRHLVLELLGHTSTPALGHRLRKRVGEDVVFSVLDTVEDRFRHRLR